MSSAKDISVGVKITGDAKGFKSASEDAQAASQKLRDKIKADSKAAGGYARELSDQFSKLAGTLGLAFGIQEINDFKNQCVELANKAEGIKVAFDKLNDPTLLARLQKATHGTVTDLELMTYAVRANNFKISLQQLPVYFEFASKRARDTGESVDYLVESIVTGIGRKSALILDNLGISSSELNEQLKKTPDYADAVGAIIKKNMKDAGEYIDSAADKAARLNATLENNKVLLGQLYNTISLRNIKADLSNMILEGLTDGAKGAERSQKIVNAAKSFSVTFAGYFGKEFQDQVLYSFGKVQEGLDAYYQTDKANAARGKGEHIPGQAFTPKSKATTTTTGTGILPEGYWEEQAKSAADYNNVISGFNTDKIAKLFDFGATNITEDNFKWVKPLLTYQEEIAKRQEYINQVYTNTGQIFRFIGGAIDSTAGSWLNYVGSVIDAIPTLITQITAMTAAQEAHAIAGAVAGANDMPYPWNLIAMATSIAATVAGLATTIPKMAQGAVVNGATYAMIGEAGPEAVLNKMQLSELVESVKGNEGFVASTRIRGKDILVTIERTLTNKTKNT